MDLHKFHVILIIKTLMWLDKSLVVIYIFLNKKGCENWYDMNGVQVWVWRYPVIMYPKHNEKDLFLSMNYIFKRLKLGLKRFRWLPEESTSQETLCWKSWFTDTRLWYPTMWSSVPCIMPSQFGTMVSIPTLWYYSQPWHIDLIGDFDTLLCNFACPLLTSTPILAANRDLAVC